jgi:hypothetical protein
LCCTCEGRLINRKAQHRVHGKGCDVKMIIAAIKPYKLDEVREALTAIGVRGMLSISCRRCGLKSW